MTAWRWVRLYLPLLSIRMPSAPRRITRLTTSARKTRTAAEAAHAISVVFTATFRSDLAAGIRPGRTTRESGRPADTALPSRPGRQVRF
jgi:hypothetical protein